MNTTSTTVPKDVVLPKKPIGVIKAMTRFAKWKLREGVYLLRGLPLLLVRIFPVSLSAFAGYHALMTFLPWTTETMAERVFLSAIIGMLSGGVGLFPTTWFWNDWIDEVVSLSQKEE